MYCNLCPRMCNSRRLPKQLGFCGQTEEIRVARAALHFWEEPCISGQNGSGAVFFCGCNLGCIYCQNYEIAHGNAGKPISGNNAEGQEATIPGNNAEGQAEAPIGIFHGQLQAGQTVSRERLAEIFLELQEKNAHNINLVTPSHFVAGLAPALRLAKEQGLRIPIVYNSSAYEHPDTLKRLEGLVDVYLPDFKYMEEEKAGKYSFAPDYPSVAKAAIAEMFRQVGKNQFQGDCMCRGVLIRHLVLPLGVGNAKRVISYVWDTYGNEVYLSIMNQYTPPAKMAGQQRVLPYPELNRKVTKREYEQVVDYAISLGITNAFFQEGDVAKESFIPAFDGEGI